MKVQKLDVSVYRIPTDRPEADGTIQWDSTTLVVVEAVADSGQRGLGFTYGAAAAGTLIHEVLSQAVRGIPVEAVGAAWEAMVRAVRNVGRPGIASQAISAVDIALWDLKARAAGLPLFRLLGQRRDRVPVYGSGGFTSYSLKELEEQLGGWVAEGIPRVKMKIGKDWGTQPEEDLRRVQAARRAIGPETELFVDSNGAYTPKQAIQMAGRFVDYGVTYYYDGVRMRVGPTSEEQLDDLIAGGGRQGEIYARLKALRDRYADRVRQRYPDIPRRVSGYNLPQLLPENGFNVARALVGSECSCVIVLEARTRLVYSPPARLLLVLGYPDVYTAGYHVPQIMEHGPIGLEGIDNRLIETMRRKELYPTDIGLLPEGDGWLLVEFGGESKQEADGRAREVMEALKRGGHPPSMKLFDDVAQEERIWTIRESGLGATANVPGEPLTSSSCLDWDRRAAGRRHLMEIDKQEKPKF